MAIGFYFHWNLDNKYSFLRVVGKERITPVYL